MLKGFMRASIKIARKVVRRVLYSMRFLEQLLP